LLYITLVIYNYSSFFSILGFLRKAWHK